MLAGPAVGNALLLLLEPGVSASSCNALIYLPLLLWLWRAPYGPRFRRRSAVPGPAARPRSMLSPRCAACAATP